jgi:PIN domain nuclease of toxin-antitoxin system
MRYLLDTHTFIWWDGASSLLSSTAIGLLKDSSNTFYLSVASIWEMQIKIQLGKMTLPNPLPRIIADQQINGGIRLLPVRPQHIFRLDTLPFHHRDPFDRLLIAQALHENLSIITEDKLFTQYPASIVWY